MSKLNIMIECTEKNNEIENSVNMVVGVFINVSHYLQWVPIKLVFVDCRSSISIERQGGLDHYSSLKSNHIFLLRFH